MLQHTTYKIRSSWHYLIGGIILCIPAIYNGYPFIYSDTGTYITTGFELILPEERPIFYGIFLMLSSFRISAWLAIIVQGIIGYFLIYEFAGLLWQEQKKKIYAALLVSFCLSLTTNLGIGNSTLIPDIFQGYYIVAFFLLLLKKHSKLNRVVLYVVFLMGLSFHSSGIPVMLLLMMSLFIVFLMFRKRIKNLNLFAHFSKAYKCCFACVVFVATFFIVVNGIYFKSYSLNAFSHVFLCGRYSESGLLKMILVEEQKEGRVFKLTAYKDSLPATAQEFVWTPQSPMHKEGGWFVLEKEMKEIVKLSFTKPKYLMKNIKEAFVGTGQQLIRFDNGYGLYAYPDGSAPVEAIKKHLPFETGMLANSFQQHGNWNFQKNDYLQLAIIVISLLIIGFLIFSKKLLIESQIILLIIILALLCNAFICGGFANAIDRLQARVIWLLPLFVLMTLMKTDLRKK